MGVQVNRIEKEFIFTNLMNQGAPLSVHGNKKEFLFRIQSFQEEELELVLAEKGDVDFEKDDDIRIFFPFQNNYYTFNARVLDRTAEGLSVGNPKSIYRDPQRKFERIKLKGIKLYFLLAGDKVELDFPKTETFTMIENPKYSSTFNPQRMADLIATFRSSVQEKVTDLKIVMYRDKAPQSFEERLTVKVGKTLWIPASDDDLPLNDPDFSGNVIVKKEVEDFLAGGGTPPHLVRSEIANLLYTKAKNNVVSEIYCPILYHEYAVGYIYAVNRRPRLEKFDQDFLDYVIQFSRVLSYSLEINGYYRQHRKTEVEHFVSVLDMSASGLLFGTTAEEIDKKIELFHDLQLHMDITDRQLVIGTRIMRKFRDADHWYFAAQFLDVAEDDLNFIFEYLYGKPFSETQKTWEGGVPPPPLSMEKNPD